MHKEKGIVMIVPQEKTIPNIVKNQDNLGQVNINLLLNKNLDRLVILEYLNFHHWKMKKIKREVNKNNQNKWNRIRWQINLRIWR